MELPHPEGTARRLESLGHVVLEFARSLAYSEINFQIASNFPGLNIYLATLRISREIKISKSITHNFPSISPNSIADLTQGMILKKSEFLVTASLPN